MLESLLDSDGDRCTFLSYRSGLSQQGITMRPEGDSSTEASNLIMEFTSQTTTGLQTEIRSNQECFSKVASGADRVRFDLV